jgi:hypothetical protein
MVDFVGKVREKEERVFGLEQQDVNALKQSNLLGVSAECRKSFARATAKAGWDYGNSSSFLSLTGGLDAFLSLGSKY